MAATSLNGLLEDFYSKPRLVYREELHLDVKAEMCVHISSSPLIRYVFLLEPLSFTKNDALYDILKDNYPAVHEVLYEVRNSTIRATNHYKERELVVGERIVKDFIFSCIGVHHVTGNVTQYYVSYVSLFNADKYKNHHVDQMKGVFIFMERNAKLQLVAMAEQPGYVVDPAHLLFSFELVVKPESTYEKHEVEDTICGLTIEEKIRLCTIVLNTPIYHEEAKFLPTAANVDDRCFRGEIRIHEDNKTDDVVDWMIGCRGEHRETYAIMTYYVSAGFDLPDLTMFCTKNEPGDKIMVGGVGCRIDVRKKVKYPAWESLKKLG